MSSIYLSVLLFDPNEYLLDSLSLYPNFLMKVINDPLSFLFNLIFYVLSINGWKNKVSFPTVIYPYLS